MAITIPLNGVFKLTYKLKRVGTAGEAIAGVSFIKDGGTIWSDAIWLRLINPVVGTTYILTCEGLTLNDSSDINPTITTTGTYGGNGAAWNGYSGSPVVWASGTFPDGTNFVVYRAKTGTLENRQNEIWKAAELIVTSAVGGSELVDWYLSK